ncbi:maleylacetoacetate isomerase [Nitrogeniibacter mangrovi]|uniref:Maleylacetoacetate isomerase n=1 Tax=Nitrogeniibacter mangrovi TaxID=2016596 RepID=A0A6C1B8T5_9RHOO|nr:maleylacetoacetate isomerase [Nitrogeniibacter mangrovi]QID19148.1 maleylacetoacetate isomerase [Nitrogeniibacter mangrovi]
MRLYGYWRSTAAYRVRIALQLKGLSFESQAVDLRAAASAQHRAAYAALNPQHLVPTLVDGDTVIGQSLAIIEYLDERYPQPPLLPGGAVERARARQIALAIGADLHPLNNLRVLNYLENTLGADAAARRAWYHHWLRLGLDACERLVDERGPFALGEAVGLADLCIVPQLYNARRYDFALDACPRLCRIDAACAGLDAFARAVPERQPDAPAGGA